MDITPPFGISERQKKTFPTYLQQEGDCIVWTGAKARGYAMYGIAGKMYILHRKLWLDHKGPLTADEHLDHLCRNRACVNIDHLEPVTLVENVMRGEGVSAKNLRKTHCKRGHEFTPENTYLFKNKSGNMGRQCRECQRANSRKWKARP